jgi:DNA-directed RNA polymerase subunit RPC12/RpoP
MTNDDLDDFFLEGGDEMMNSEPCPKCGASIYLDRPIEWIDQAEGICICPHCGEKVKINP